MITSLGTLGSAGSPPLLSRATNKAVIFVVDVDHPAADGGVERSVFTGYPISLPNSQGPHEFDGWRLTRHTIALSILAPYAVH